MTLLIIQTSFAAVIGISPSIAHFNRMLRGGYAQSSVLVSTSFDQDIRARITPEGDIADWVTFFPNENEFVFSRAEPYRFTIIMQPPEDTPSGNYTGMIKIRTDEIAEVQTGAGSSILAEVALLVFVEEIV